jgi:ABC-type amino acid transport substrate-binding protein
MLFVFVGSKKPEKFEEFYLNFQQIESSKRYGDILKLKLGYSQNYRNKWNDLTVSVENKYFIDSNPDSVNTAFSGKIEAYLNQFTVLEQVKEAYPGKYKIVGRNTFSKN